MFVNVRFIEFHSENFVGARPAYNPRDVLIRRMPLFRERVVVI